MVEAGLVEVTVDVSALVTGLPVEEAFMVVEVCSGDTTHLAPTGINLVAAQSGLFGVCAALAVLHRSRQQM